MVQRIDSLVLTSAQRQESNGLACYLKASNKPKSNTINYKLLDYKTNSCRYFIQNNILFFYIMFDDY